MTLVNAETGELALTLDDLEEVIERGLATFVEVGEALKAIRDSRLYRQSFDTFEEYCEERWALSRKRAYDMIQAAAVSATVSQICDTAPPVKESHAAALAPLRSDPDAMAEAWTAAKERTGGKPTALDVKEEVHRLLRPSPPLPPTRVDPERQRHEDREGQLRRDARRLEEFVNGWITFEHLSDNPDRDEILSRLIDHDRAVILTIEERFMTGVPRD